MPYSRTSSLLPVGFLLLLGCMGFSDEPAPRENRWWKGNLHTHSLWSDGDDFPEMISAWYREQGYHFLAISDHNTLNEGMRWMSQSQIESRGGKVILEKYRRAFGDEWIETRKVPATEKKEESIEVRLKPLDEYRYLVEERDRFILIPAEEISDKAEGKPVHMNATNLAQVIKPLGGATVREVMQNNLRSILEQEEKLGRQILAHLNHPNFGYGVSAEELAEVISEQFFEIYNGHPSVNQLGDKEHPSMERVWDLANAIRCSLLDAPPLFGIATDDSHEYHGKPGARPGRGWIMVRSRFLTPEYLIRSMEAGAFYASSGVTLESVDFDTKTKRLSLVIQADPNATYQTSFIATLRPSEKQEATTSLTLPKEDSIGKIVATVDGLQPEYTCTGNEYYVRAIVTSSLAPKDPVWKDQKQQAWTQPVGWLRRTPTP